MLTIRRYFLALELAVKLHVEVWQVRRQLVHLLGREQIRRLFNELYRPLHIAAILALFGVAAQRSKSREIVAERQAIYQLWRRLVLTPCYETEFQTTAAKAISRAAIARTMRDICGESPSSELLESLPPIDSVGQFLRRWLEVSGAAKQLASRDVLARNVNYFCANYAILAVCGKDRENWTPDFDQLRERNRELKKLDALLEEGLRVEYQVQLLRLLAFPMAMYKVVGGG